MPSTRALEMFWNWKVSGELPGMADGPIRFE